MLVISQMVVGTKKLFVSWKLCTARPSCLRLLVHLIRLAASRTFCTAGKSNGRVIELTEDLGIAEGAEVEVSVRTLAPGPARQPGEGLLRTEGALADDPHWDAIMDQVRRARGTMEMR